MSKQQNRKRIETQIKVLGRLSFGFQDDDKLINIDIDCHVKNLSSKLDDSKVNPIKIMAQGNSLAFVDDKDNLWLITQSFNRPVNISSITHKRCIKVALNQRELVMCTRKEHILVNWGAKKLFEAKQLSQVTVSQRSSFHQVFKAYRVQQSNRDDSYLFSTIKKCDNSNKMYSIKRFRDKSETCLTGYPSLQSFTVPFIIKGISVGKYHSLCWSNDGRLFSWGSRSIALGYQNLPRQMQITEPQPVDNIQQFIISAFAASNYSLALSSQGIIYEWGIKKDINQLNEQLIFKPKQIQIYCPEEQSKGKPVKFVSLKGRKDHFAAVSNKGEFYVWGLDCKDLIEKMNFTEKVLNQRIYEPTLVQSLKQYKIVDYAVEQNFIAVITTSKLNNLMMEQEKVYWDEMLGNVQRKWGGVFKRLKTENSKRFKSEGSQNLSAMKNRFSQALTKNDLSSKQKNVFSLNKSKFLTERYSSINFSNGKISQDKVETQFKKEKLKQGYIEIAQNQSQLFNYIMQGSNSSRKLCFQTDKAVPKSKVIKRKYFAKSMNNEQRHQFTAFSKNQDEPRTLNTVNTRFSQIDENDKANSHFKSSINISDVKKFIQQHEKREINKSAFFQLQRSTGTYQFALQKMVSSKPYKMRLQQVKQKKKNIEYQLFFNTLRKVQQNSLQYRQKKHEQLMRKRQNQKLRQNLKKGLQTYLIKNIVIQGLCYPLGQARRLKIDNFGLQLKLQRKEKLIRQLFAKRKAKSSINLLQIKSFSTFLNLCHVFKRYIARRRKQKYQKMRKFIIEQLMKSIIKQKIRIGMARVILTVKKLQKLYEWIKMTKKERLKCLKIRWKYHILNNLKFHHQSDNNAFQAMKHEEISFGTLYEDKKTQNPNLKLINFLNSNAIFSFRFQYFQKIAELFSFGEQRVYKSERILKTMNTINLGSTRKTKIRFFDQQRERMSSLGIQHTDILPYSLHANILLKPAVFQLNMPQNFKNNQLWVKQQKQILEKCLLKVIRDHDSLYIKKKRTYDYQLALFIKSKYEKLSQRRWKSIVQFNRIVKTFSKKRKQKELARLMNLVGGNYLVQQDYLPEKYLVLQQAIKRSDAPKIPVSTIVFGQNQFKRVFKQYFQIIHGRMRHLRKTL